MNTETDNITEELSKLLRQSKDIKKKNEEDNEEEEDNDNYDSDNDLNLDTNIQERVDKISVKDLVNAVTDLKSDTLQILQLLDVLNSEVDLIKERLSKLEHNNHSNKNSSNEIEKIQERMDKVLSVKLDEFNLKFSKINKLKSKNKN